VVTVLCSGRTPEKKKRVAAVVTSVMKDESVLRPGEDDAAPEVGHGNPSNLGTVVVGATMLSAAP